MLAYGLKEAHAQTCWRVWRCAPRADLRASAEVSQLRISRGFGVHYLPLYVMEAKGLLQKQAAADGLGDVKVEFLLDRWRQPHQ